MAHRGYWNTVGSAHNSIAALRKANKIKAYGSEFDVQMTKDHKIVVSHDDDINGIKIITANYSDVKHQRLPNGEKLPTLQEYLENGHACKDTKLILEIKPHPTEELENQCVDKVVSWALRSPLSLKTTKQRSTKTRTGPDFNPQDGKC